MIELELASAQHQIFVLQLELLIEEIQGGDFDAAVVGNPRACALGTWLYGAGLTLSHLPAHAELLREHERLHEVAGRMVKLFHAGDAAAARNLLVGPFAETSRAVAAAIVALKRAGRARQERVAPGSETASGPLLPTDPDMLTGIALIDAQHGEITEIIIRLLVHPHEHLEAPMMADTLRELGDLIALHFQSEELFMKHAGVPALQLEEHQRQHAELLGRYRRLALQPGMHDASGPCNMCLAVEHWMTDHVRIHDLALKSYAHIPYP